MSRTRNLRYSRAVLLFLFTMLSAVSFSTTIRATIHVADDSFGIKEYDDFHHVLHHLQHEALPKNDLAEIRSKSKDLIKLGEAVVKLGVPKGTKGEDADKFQSKLTEFSKALEKYGTDAESGTDADLKNSYGAVHEKFEELADMLPKK